MAPRTAPAGEVATIAATRAFYQGLTTACEADVAQIEVALANLAALELDQDTLDGFQSAQEDAQRAAERCRTAIAVLDARQGLLEEAVNATPDAARTEFYQDGDPRPYGQGGSRPATARPASGTNPEETEMPAVPQPHAAEAAASYHRCDRCGYVIGPRVEPPGGCPSCQTRGGSFTPTEIVFPAAPGEEAIARDTRDVEAAIRAAYAGLAHAGPAHQLTKDVDAFFAQVDPETLNRFEELFTKLTV